jgi:predicted transglutaminase-like cysteine proteinase
MVRLFMDKPFFRRLLLALLCCFYLTAIAETKGTFTLTPKFIAAVEKRYGAFAKRRLLAWQKLIRDQGEATDDELLERVNSFFNRMEFVDDIVHWKKKDYWATPVEFLVTGGGDCEDFSLAKYFTLKAMGVDEEKLNLTYVKAVRLNQAHMVLTYHRTPEAEPLVLDNLIGAIRKASERNDLIPVYSFNGTGLWLAKARGRGQKVGGSDRLKRWRDLLARMPEGL